MEDKCKHHIPMSEASISRMNYQRKTGELKKIHKCKKCGRFYLK